MANRERGAFALTIGGRVYTFRLTTSAMAELEDACSTPLKVTTTKDGQQVTTPAVEMTFPQILGKVQGGSAKYIALFVWAALLEHHPTLTVKEASALIDEAGGLVAFAGQIQHIVGASQPDAEESRPPEAQDAGTGARSTSKRAKSA
jgi:hypothetical protein